MFFVIAAFIAEFLAGTEPRFFTAGFHPMGLNLIKI